MASVQSTVADSRYGRGVDVQIPVENPATGQVIAHVSDLTARHVAELAVRGRAAQPGWQALGFEGRGRVLARMQKWLMDSHERVTSTIISETGKTREDAYMSELTYTGGALAFWIKHAEGFLADEPVAVVTLPLKGKKLAVRYEPVGLVGVIAPWNYPLINSFGDCVPALMAGNSVILKPSELTPLTSLLVAEGLAECGLADGVFAVATGRGATGAALVDDADMIMFTGSTATGRKVMERAARTLTPVSLELGGKDPLIVLADANLERAANAAVYYSMQNAGQTCISIERVYVEEPVYDAFVEKVVDKVRALRQGPSTAPGSVEVGAMTSPEQLRIVADHVDDALAKGARALTGARQRDIPGSFYEPTVLVDVDHSMKAMTQETFGPTLPIMKVADAEQAIARRLQAGAVCVNDALLNYFAVELPMGGWKASGLGTRHGAGGIRKYTKQQSLLVNRINLDKDPFMFPYRARVSKALFRGVRLLYGRRMRRG